MPKIRKQQAGVRVGLVSEMCRNAGDMGRRASWCVDAATIISGR
jgi:hypothetical protein